MNALHKYAAKKQLSKKMIERFSSILYGKKPTQSSAATGAALGGVGGAALGGSAGGAIGLRKGIGKLNKRMAEDVDKHGLLGLLSHGAMLPINFGIYGGGGALAGGAPGALGGGLGGAAIGGLLGKRLDKARMVEYLAKKKKINKRLALGATAGVGTGGGLAALLASDKG